MLKEVKRPDLKTEKQGNKLVMRKLLWCHHCGLHVDVLQSFQHQTDFCCYTRAPWCDNRAEPDLGRFCLPLCTVNNHAFNIRPKRQKLPPKN